ncbi:MAG TPA: hypothetical protein VKE96_12525 [Vicinamibacterales bacterium]|nr:hypothetical protein [Vicinamibacterales bacterium]
MPTYCADCGRPINPHADHTCREQIRANRATAREQARGRNGWPYKLVTPQGRTSYYRTISPRLRKRWTQGDVLYQWYEGRWRIWTSAGLV